jgi:prefoldin subunit 5
VRQGVLVFDAKGLGQVLEQTPEPGLVPIGQLVTLRVGVEGAGPTEDRLDQIEEQQREMQEQLGTVQRTLDTVSEQLKKLLEESSGGPRSGSAKS